MNNNWNLTWLFQLHASLVCSRSPLNEKPTSNFNCDGTHNSNINNTTTKVNSGTTIESSLQQQALGATTNIDINQKLFGFTGIYQRIKIVESYHSKCVQIF